MAKTIVFCADGTWNGPGQDEDGDRQADPTNVYKLFYGLAGSNDADSLRDAEEQEKSLLQNGVLLQKAKYIHGVGDSRNPIHKLFGGAFGAGILARIVRGYTFISRNYERGDRIVIVGFSRGAYTARALAGFIAVQGLLGKHLTADKETAYRSGAKAWYRYRNNKKRQAGFLQSLAEVMSDLPAYMSKNTLKKTDFVPVPSLTAVGVWDTVGAMGLPNYIQEPGADAFRFADTVLNAKVQHGFHALALDECRVDFIPTLWDVGANVEQVLFPGAHADVGGGYTMNNNESGLSDVALQWMVDKLGSVGVVFNTPIYPLFKPDPLGIAHQPWDKFPFNDPLRIQPRRFPQQAIVAHASIAQRTGKSVKAAPQLAARAYQPRNLA
jgi:uncharacterized protein (DUF2235 family)